MMRASIVLEEVTISELKIRAVATTLPFLVGFSVGVVPHKDCPIYPLSVIENNPISN
jgi:hypothetical protein